MKIVTSDQMREIDREAIEKYGISSLILMENAGFGVFKNLKKIYPNLNKKTIFIFAGSGNNGGDSFVVARHLHNSGVEVKVFLMNSLYKIKGDARTNLNIIDKMGIELNDVTSLKLEDLEEICRSCDIIIDAILGTGLKGKVTGVKAKMIEAMNHSGKEIVAIDIPSGLNANSGNVENICVKADYTITLALPKIGLMLYPGASYVGKLIVEDISIPQPLLIDNKIKCNLITEHHIKSLLPRRLHQNNKGTFGKVLLLAGSVGMTGAAYLTAEAAIKSGTGIVVLGIPKSLNDIMEVKLTEVMTLPLSESREKSLDQEAEEKILEIINDFCVLGVGPGISRHQTTQELIQNLIQKVNVPIVLDADALFGLGEKVKLLKDAKIPIVITPHPGEMARLINKEISYVLDNSLEVAKKVASELGIIVVLKGARTIIADDQGNTFINIGDNSGMATAGSGDLLTGMISSLIAQGLNEISAAIAGVYIHSFSGNLARQSKGERGMTAIDILKKVPYAFFEIENKK